MALTGTDNPHANSLAMPFQALARPTARALLLCLIVLAAAPFWQARWGTIPDTSWLIHVCERLLAGDRLYVDVVETNPPFSIWLYLPVVWLANVAGWSPEAAVHAFTYGAVLLGLAFAANVMRRANFAENAGLVALSPLLLALFLIFPGSAFSEREHIATALVLPLLALTAWRLRGGDCAPGLPLAIGVGLAGAVLVLVKPHYAAVILVPALYVAWRTRRLMLVLSAEYWTIGLTCATYLAAVLTFHPEFLRDIFPVLAATYMRMVSLIPVAVNFGIVLALLLALAWKLKPATEQMPALAAVALLAGTAAIVPLFLQGKGWPYHAYPALALVLIAMLCLLAAFPGRRPGQPSAALLASAAIAAWAPFLSTQKPDRELVATLRAAAPAPTMATISSDLADGHPLVRMLGGRWPSPYNADWVGAYAQYQGLVAKIEGRPEDAARYEAIAKDYLDEKLAALEAAPPDLLLVQYDEELWVLYVMRDPRAKALMARYRLLVPGAQAPVYIRRDLVNPPSSPAAASG